MNNEKSTTDHTSGSIIKAIISMGAPSMLGFMATHIYTMVDTWWVSQLPGSQSAVAGLVVFNNIMWFFGSINVMVGAGSVAVISRRYGEKRFDLAEKAIKETFLMKFVAGALFGTLGLTFLTQFVTIAGATGQMQAYSVDYGAIMFWGMPFAFVAFSVFTALRSIANPKMAMNVMLASTALNLILDPILIFGYLGFPAMGIQGAAYASVISYIMVVIVGVIIFFGGFANLRLRLFSKTKLGLSTMWHMLRIGLPSWVSSATDSGMRLALTPLVALYGERVVAAYGIGLQVVGFGIMLVVGIGLGLSALIGHTIGVGKLERARKTGDRALALAASIMTILGIAVYVFARQFAELYFTDLETIRETVDILRVFAFGFPIWGVWIMLEGLFGGVGMNKPAMLVSLVQAFVLQIPMAYLLVKFYNASPHSLWISVILIAYVSTIGFWLYYRRGTWLHAKV